MSLANKLDNIYTKLNIALNDVNSALVKKGGNEANDILGIGDKIREIENGGSNELAMSIIDGLITKIDLSEITSIRPYAFAYTSLQSIIIPSNVTDIGVGIFQGCTYLTSATINSNILSIPHNAFFWCLSLTNITIPDSVTEIGIEAFSCCQNLTNIVIPNNVTTIQQEAFANSGITNITIPNGVSRIEEKLCYRCENLTDIYIRRKSPPRIQVINGTFPTTSIIHVPVGSGDNYKSETGWSYFADQIVEDIILEQEEKF